MYWLLEVVSVLQTGDTAVSALTSGDIDSIPIHLFALSHSLRRDSQNKFPNPVYIVQDHYTNTETNIFQLKWLLDFVWEEMASFQNCTVLKLLFQCEIFQNTLFNIDDSEGYLTISINKNVYAEFVKQLFSLKKNAKEVTLEELYSITKYGRQKAERNKAAENLRNHQPWLPPRSVLDWVGDLIDIYTDYLLTVEKADAPLPDFSAKGCQEEWETVEIEYNIGPEGSIQI